MLERKEKRIMRGVTKLLTMVLSVIIALSLFGQEAYASEKAVIIETAREDGTIHFYAKGFSEKENLSVLVGKNACKISDIKKVKESGTPIKTLVLIDNSVKSVDDSQRQFSEFLDNYIADKSPSEQIAISVFSDTITTVVEYTDDYYTLINSSKEIGYSQQNTYLTDILYDLLESYSSSGETGYRRIILMTDGCEDEYVGITRDELFDALEENPVPIYVLGCKNKENLSDLESVFGLSRKTGAGSYILNDIENKLDIAEELKKDEDVLRISVELDEQLMDGSEKTVKISNGQSSASIDIRMPQTGVKREQKENTKPKTNSATEERKEGQSNEKSQNEVNKTEKKNLEKESDKSVSSWSLVDFFKDNWIWFAIGGGVLLILIILLIVIIASKRKTRNGEKTIQGGFETIPAPDLDPDKTVKVNFAPDVEEGGTVHLWGNRAAYVTLRDMNRPEMVFRQMINGSLTIGRNHSKNLMVIDYDRSISGQHCIVSMKEGNFYITDSGSSNGTFVNNERVSNETMLKTGDTIMLGQTVFSFEGTIS